MLDRFHNSLHYLREESEESPSEIYPENSSITNQINDYHTLLQSVQIGMCKHLLSDALDVIWANESFYQTQGFTEERFHTQYNQSAKGVFYQAPAEYERLKKAIHDAYEAGKINYEVLIHFLKEDGTYAWLNLHGTFTNETVNGVPVVFMVMNDVTALISTQKEQGITQDYIPGFIAKVQITKTAPHLIYINDKFANFFKVTDVTAERLLIKQNLSNNANAFQKHYPDMLQKKPVSFEVCITTANEEVFYFRVNGGCVDTIKDDPVYLLVFIDITEITKQREQMRELAFVDPVTKGFNRTRFEIDAGTEIANAPAYTYSLVSLNLQKFKVINDLFGVNAGDDVLQHIHNCIFKNLGEGEFVARLAADSFAILLKNDTPQTLENRIKGFAEEMNLFNENSDYKFFLIIDAGICPIDNPATPITHFQDRANVARKKIKITHNPNVLCACNFYKHHDRLQMAHEKSIENRMQSALKNHEFCVYLQPKQNLSLDYIEGAEALVRWQDPAHGLIPPNDFIPLFEQNGFIVQVDLYVFEVVCSILKKWLQKGKTPLPISVNVSRVHLNDSNFLEKYEAIRRKYGVAPKLLELEITESLIFENPILLQNTIKKIHEYGYLCSMDDFGSGYSSLNILKSIEVDILKLDRAFFSSDEITDQKESDIIKFVIDLARKLNMKTVAEGVETQAQAAFLKECGCNTLQGFLISRPVPIQDFETLVFGNVID